ncbi:flagellin [Ferribacterium limneticum]|uniref:flagellin n=1 Tax=Ferribacterium limneticum TaxID=76259 RepID=UPI001CFB627E|nr:flagellin [Ferribacterium limneticum]UCV19774.1 flagellin FliC [Ferribacterium limneticum]
MAATINTNTYSLNAQRNLAKNSLGLASAIERLSSGLRVNSARDDASGLARGMTLETSARTTAVNIRDLGDQISTAETEDGALSVLNDVLQRMGELNAQSDMTNTSDELTALASQASTLATAGGATITITATSDTAAITSAIGVVASTRAAKGATMNNAEFQIQAAQVSYANQMAARGRIMDADFAEETSRLSRFQILQQAGTAMVAQANAIPQNVLTLLR